MLAHVEVHDRRVVLFALDLLLFDPAFLNLRLGCLTTLESKYMRDNLLLAFLECASISVLRKFLVSHRRYHAGIGILTLLGNWKDCAV